MACYGLRASCIGNAMHRAEQQCTRLLLLLHASCVRACVAYRCAATDHSCVE